MKELTKKVIEKKIFYTCKFVGMFSKPYKWGQVKRLLAEKNIELQDDDILRIEFEEGYDDGDSARDSVYSISVYRQVIETDEEFEKRVKATKKIIDREKESRYKTYLKLKKEFENGTTD
jgi:hypothetical protein